MATRKTPSRAPAPKRRKTSGPTHPEAAREAKQKLLRLTPPQLAALSRLAGLWGTTESAAVARAVAAALAAEG